MKRPEKIREKKAAQKPAVPGVTKKRGLPYGGDGDRQGDTVRHLEKLGLDGMGNLAAAIAHELRQPLGAIQNLAVYLKATISSPGPKFAQTLDVLEQQAELAGRILSNLVDLARAGKPRTKTAQLHSILKDVLKRIARRPEIRLHQRLGERLPRIMADPFQVERILSNLITNGLESMDGPGTLTIATRAERRSVLVRITDTGCGIGPEQSGDIFRAFVTTKPTGTGLGLALCRQFAEANGGSIGFKSRPGKGTTFQLRLPRI